VRFKKEVFPGERLDITTKITFWKRRMYKGTGVGYTNGSAACEADMVLSVPTILKQHLPTSELS
jgi:3-hydroxyacyl-[acyl-carrier-protein] dehydratase